MFGTLMAAAGVALIGYGVWRGHRQFIWRAVMGHIEDLILEPYEPTDDSEGGFSVKLGGGPHYWPHICYRYSFNGRQYKNTGLGHSCSSKDEAYKLYTVGGHISLRVNPARPQQSVLALSPLAWAQVIGWLIGGVVLFMNGLALNF